MPTDRSARRRLSYTLGISAVFDVTGATIIRAVRQSLPPPPPASARPDPFESAMDTIMAAHREVLLRARNSRGPTLLT